MIDPLELARVKTALASDVPRLLVALGMKARREGGGWKVLCPAHSERTPSCRVDVQRGVLVWHCHGCGAGGDAIELVGAVEGLSRFVDKANRAAALAGIHIEDRPGEYRPVPQRERTPDPPPERPKPEDVAAVLASCVRVTEDEGVSVWLRSRHIDPHAVERYELAFALPASVDVMTLPFWARPWVRSGHRAIFRCYDAEGRVVCLRAGLIRAPGGGLLRSRRNRVGAACTMKIVTDPLDSRPRMAYCMGMSKRSCGGGCGAKTGGSWGYCPRCKGAMARGAKRAEKDEILVDFAGGAAWAWDKLGNVLAGPADTKGPIWIALANGES